MLMENEMGKKQSFLGYLLVFGLYMFSTLMGCQGTSLTTENDPHTGPSPGYQKGGPPPWAPAHGYRAKHRYYYYPSYRVYYEKERGVYFYYKDGKWRASVSLPSEVQISSSNYLILEMDSDKPYEYDHEVVKRYPPGQLKKKNKGKKGWK